MGIELLEEGLTSDTKKAYSSVWQKSAEICCSLEKLDWAKLPISSHTLFLFLTHNFHEGKSGATIASSSSVIAYVHKLTGHRDPTNTQAIRNLIVSAQKKAPSNDVRCPINSFILKNLISDLSSFCQNYDKIMLEALFLTLFHGFFKAANYWLELNTKS